MTPYEECAREALLTFGPILLACLCGAIGWAVNRGRGRRR
jgi:hypothetical protein